MKEKHSISNRGSAQYLPSAPLELIRRYEARPAFPGRMILGQLLTDNEMRRAWTELKRHIKCAEEWESFWQEIVYARHVARRDSQLHPPNQRSRTKRKNQFLAIASNAESLAQMIDEGPLDDLLAYHLFPDKVMRILGVENWAALDRLDQSDAARQLLSEWPTIPELLRELAALAEQSADESVTKKNPAARTTLEREPRVFLNIITTYLTSNYSVVLYGTVAKIATVVFGRPITKKLVESVVKGP